MRRQFHFIADRDGDVFEFDRDEVRQAMLDLEGALYQLGGAVTIVAVREQTGPETYATVGMIVNYDSYTPAARRDVAVDEDGSEEIEDASLASAD